MKREAARLFPPGYFEPRELTAREQAEAKAKTLRASAANLRDLAGRGMSPRKFEKAAARLEAEAGALLESVGE